MKIAITGGTGFVGRYLARSLVSSGHQVVLIARGIDRRDSAIHQLGSCVSVSAGLDDEQALARAFESCDGVAHCAGINREVGNQTYQRVHVEGTQNVVYASSRAGVKKVALMSFLRARANCGSAYHESKWQAEEIVRGSGLDYTILKAGIIYGKGDQMLDHLSHSLRTFPVFALVGMTDRPMRPLAVEDLVRIAEATLTQHRLSRETVAVTGPEELSLREVVSRVARALGKRTLIFPAPVLFHRVLAWGCEHTMATPLVSSSQVLMLSEGIADPLPPCNGVPAELAPTIRFTQEQILKSLPAG